MTEVIVEIEQGKLCGRIVKDVNGNDYKSFQGIPFAKPPIGKLRFKAPEPPEPWEDEILDAKTERSMPFQPKFMGKEKYCGSEDCLYLNVFTPQLANDSPEKLPVMVYIYGGGFFTGSCNSDSCGPEFIVAKKVILITFNYRLGCLGFLSLKDPTCGVTGNAGLKDQTQALRWIEKNISCFGGDSNNVTIFGASAGSASASYHLLSPLSKGLFHKVILQSGVALNSWALQIRHDYKFVHLLGCKSTDDKEILEFLQEQKLQDILYAQRAVISPETQPYGEFCDITPVIEPNIPSAFITDTPENILREGRFHQVPIIIGGNDKEGLALNSPASKYNLFKEYWFKNDRLITRDLQEKLKHKENIEKATEEIKEFYNITDIESMIDYWTDILFMYKIGMFVKEFARKSNQPIYNYLFRISINSMKIQSKIFNWNYEGACHTDEIPYLFRQSILPQVLPNTPEFVAIHIMTTLWTNFAKNGNPNPVNSDPHINFKWKPFTINDENYLEIDLKSQLKKNILKKRMQFWDNLYKQ